MVAVSRWNEYDVDAETNHSSVATGDRAVSIGNDAGLFDTVTITSTTNEMKVNMGSEAFDITIASGTSLDPRFVALDIQRKVQAKSLVAASGTTHEWEFAQCKFENGKFRLWSGDGGNSASVHVSAPTSGNSALTALHWISESASNGANVACQYLTNGGVVAVGGEYHGQYDDVYTVICTGNNNLGSASVAVGDGDSFSGTITLGGDWNQTSSNDTYTITISTSNGSTMGAGTGNVPRITNVSSTGSDNSSTVVELLYPDYWYTIGSRGLRIKFSDGVFDGGANNQLAVTATVVRTNDATGSSQSTGQVGTSAKFIVRSERGDDYINGVFRTPQLALNGTAMELGSKGLTITFTGNQSMSAGDELKVFARSVRPKSGDSGITQVNYGNVTVSTDSPVKVVQFEIMSGAVILSDCKFGLYSHGTFAHHYAGDSDTLIHFGTAGAGNPAPDDDDEWTSAVSASSLNTNKTGGSTGSPESMYHTVANLTVVNSADSSEPVGNENLASDYIWLGIKVGASETGATTVTYRIFFDYS